MSEPRSEQDSETRMEDIETVSSPAFVPPSTMDIMNNQSRPDTPVAVTEPSSAEDWSSRNGSGKNAHSKEELEDRLLRENAPDFEHSYASRAVAEESAAATASDTRNEGDTSAPSSGSEHGEDVRPDTLETEPNSSAEIEPRPAAASTSSVHPASVKTELSALMQEIHNTIFEEHKSHPSPAWAKRPLRSCYVDEKQSVPTCTDLLDAYDIDAYLLPEMSVQDVSALVVKLFGPKRKYLSRVFEEEQIDGAGLLLLNMTGYLDLLKIPIGPAVTLDGICKRARELRSIPAPAD